MLRSVFHSLPCSLALLFGVALSSRAEDTTLLSGWEIIDRYMVSQEVLSEMAYLKMTMVEADGSFEENHLMVAFRYNEDASSNYLLRMLSPEAVRNISLLAKQLVNGGSNQYLYLPTVGTAKPLTGKAKSQPFLGSDFSIADLQKEVPAIHDYERQPDKFVQGKHCFVVRAVEKEAANRAYKYRDLYIDKQSYDLIRADYFDMKDRLTKVLFMFDYQSPMVKGTTKRPQRAVMENRLRNTTTVFTVLESRIDQAIEADIFTPITIENWTDEEIEEFIFSYGLTLETEG